MLMHELKNPLSGIVGATQLLQQDLQSQIMSKCNLIKFEADRIKGLLSNMENLSTGEGNISLETVNIHKILDYCINSSKRSYGSKIF